MSTESNAFENRVLNDTRLCGHVIARIPSQMQQVKGKVFRSKTDCDFAAAVDGRAIFLDAKVCGKDGFYFHTYVFDSKKVHQYNFLHDADARGCKAGYMIYFSNKDVIVWCPIWAVSALSNEGFKAVTPSSKYVTAQPYSEPMDLRRLVR